MKPKSFRPRPVEAFSEKGFYLDEFHGRTLGVAGEAEALRAGAPLLAVLTELAANDTRAVVISTDAGLLRRLLATAPVAGDDPRLPAAVWRNLQRGPWAGVAVEVAGSGFPAAGLGVAVRLGLTKVVWIDPLGGLRRPDGARDSFVDREELRGIVRAGAAGEGGERIAFLCEVERALDAGVAAVNLCSLEGLADELFTYAGSGTLFSRQRYVEVRPLGLDDYDPADDLIARGVAEGYLAPRPPEEVEAVLVNGFGAFVEGVHLAGIGALLAAGEGGEVASLYTLTRYLGGGIGGHLIRFAVERAATAGLRFVFACTTSERVVAFFESHGFREVEPDAIPAAKWEGYDPERRGRVRCLRRELPAPA
jgi:amino-acid N-acetyltransferase